MAQGVGYSRALLWGGVLGLAAVAALVVAAVLGVGAGGYAGTGVPDSVLVIAVTEDAQGANVGGILFVIDSAGEVAPIDPLTPITIPGTSYDTLQDAYPFGGGAAVARSYVGADEEVPAWLVLPQETWIDLVDQVGGVRVQVEQDADVYLGEKLISIERGARRLKGSELAAWWASAQYAGGEAAARSVHLSVAEAVAEAVTEEPDAVVDAVEREAADTPLSPDDLAAFLGK